VSLRKICKGARPGPARDRLNDAESYGKVEGERAPSGRESESVIKKRARSRGRARGESVGDTKEEL